jgi:hypothetical protein
VPAEKQILTEEEILNTAVRLNRARKVDQRLGLLRVRVRRDYVERSSDLTFKQSGQNAGLRPGWSAPQVR